MNTSKSRIKCLATCGRMFDCQYWHKKLPEIPPAAVTQVGTQVHDMFDKFYDNIKLEEIPEQPYQYFQSKYLTMKVPLRLMNIFNLFCNHQALRWSLTKNKNEFIPLFREKKIVNTFEKSDESGIIDCIFYDDGKYMILDYKSSCNDPTNLRFELNFYKKLVDDAKILDKPIEEIAAYGYRDGSSFCEDVNTRSYNSMLKKVEQFKSIDFNNYEFKKNEGNHCDWCSWKISCKKL